MPFLDLPSLHLILGGAFLPGRVRRGHTSGVRPVDALGLAVSAPLAHPWLLLSATLVSAPGWTVLHGPAHSPPPPGGPPSCFLAEGYFTIAPPTAGSQLFPLARLPTVCSLPRSPLDQEPSGYESPALRWPEFRSRRALRGRPAVWTAVLTGETGVKGVGLGATGSAEPVPIRGTWCLGTVPSTVRTKAVLSLSAALSAPQAFTKASRGGRGQGDHRQAGRRGALELPGRGGSKVPEGPGRPDSPCGCCLRRNSILGTACPRWAGLSGDTEGVTLGNEPGSPQPGWGGQQLSRLPPNCAQRERGLRPEGGRAPALLCE